VPSDRQENRPRGTQTGARPAVLIVDDQTDVAETGAEMLTFLGYDATTANSATEALDLLIAGTRVDILFLDIGMRSGMSGLDLALIARERFPAIAVLLTTGHGDALVEARDKGFDVLPKPYFVASLREALARLSPR
jgi:CheY-like chemotaxis protein